MVPTIDILEKVKLETVKSSVVVRSWGEGTINRAKNFYISENALCDAIVCGHMSFYICSNP